MNDAPAPLAPAAIAPLLHSTVGPPTAEVEALSAAALATEAGCVWQRRPAESTQPAMGRTEVKSWVLDKVPGSDGDHHAWRRHYNGSSPAIRDTFASTARG